jgi:hypothetical protein
MKLKLCKNKIVSSRCLKSIIEKILGYRALEAKLTWKVELV